MLYYTYDGTLEGLLTAVYEAYYRKQHPDGLLPDENIQIDILSSYIYICTDDQKAKKVYDAIVNKISRRVFDNIKYVFLSNYPDKDTIIYNYIRLGFKAGKYIDNYLTDNTVYKVHMIRQKVGGEAHRMLGLIRFSQNQGGILYSQIEPDHNILELVAPHFAKRLAGEYWIIHDIKRNLAAAYNKAEYKIIYLEYQGQISINEIEQRYQNLWKQYFNSIAIEERINPRLQKQYMPKRYWKHLVEK